MGRSIRPLGAPHVIAIQLVRRGFFEKLPKLGRPSSDYVTESSSDGANNKTLLDRPEHVLGYENVWRSVLMERFLVTS